MSGLKPILNVDEDCFVLFPICFPSLWAAYKTTQKSFWTTEEIDFSADLSHWSALMCDDEHRLLSSILVFFTSSDGIVAENLVQQFCAEVQVPGAQCFYGFQIMMENVHAEMYAHFLQELLTDKDELRRLFGALRTMLMVRVKADWCLKWFDRSAYSFGVRLIAFTIVEGVFFSSLFAAIMWIRSRGLMPGLCHSNKLIMRDEGQHMEFTCGLYKLLQEKVPEGVVHSMVREAVKLEQSFFQDAMPRGLCGLNTRLMNQYVEYIADFLLWCLAFPALYGAKNPFMFMEGSSLPGKANFFKRPISDYLGAAM